MQYGSSKINNVVIRKSISYLYGVARRKRLMINRNVILIHIHLIEYEIPYAKGINLGVLFDWPMGMGVAMDDLPKIFLQLV